VAVASAGPYANHVHLVPADNYASTSPFSFTGWMPFLPPKCQSNFYYTVNGFCLDGLLQLSFSSLGHFLLPLKTARWMSCLLAKQQCQRNVFDNHVRTRMWANAQPDGHPAEHRWRPLFNAAQFG